MKVIIHLVLLWLPLLVCNAFKYSFNNQSFEQLYHVSYAKGYIDEYLSSKSQVFCHSWIQFPGIQFLSAGH